MKQNSSNRLSRGKQPGVWRQQPAILTRKRKQENECPEVIESPSSSSESDIIYLDSSDSNLSPPNKYASIINSSQTASHAAWQSFRGVHAPVYSEDSARVPISLPYLVFANPNEVWDIMHEKDLKYPQDKNMFTKHPSLQPRMRSILLDWLIEVCEVYKLHRETFYLAQDFIDRYLAAETDVPKQRLQLIGITALFIASKIEEIYPPKLSEFVYVTDGACSEEDILSMELIILKVLNWNLTPITANGWLNIYLQLANNKNISEEKGDAFLIPDFSTQTFMKVAQLLDLCVLDIGSLSYSYSILAASALYHYSSEKISTSVSGYQYEDLSNCIQWMAPFVTTMRENGTSTGRFLHGVTIDEQHNIQLHSVDMSLLEKAQAKQKETEMSSRKSPLLSGGMLTPPQSEEKQLSAV